MPARRSDGPMSDRDPLPIVLACADAFRTKARYVFDTLLMAADIRAVYMEHPPSCGPWISYGAESSAEGRTADCLSIAHSPQAWRYLHGQGDASRCDLVEGLPAIFADRSPSPTATSHISFDLIANAFFVLSSWPERETAPKGDTRCLYANSVYARLGVPQDVVDRYLHRLIERLNALNTEACVAVWPAAEWPEGAEYAVVLSHDVDFLPSGFVDNVAQGAKTLLRHLLRQRDPTDAALAAVGLTRALVRGRDPYGCVPEIICEEQRRGVRASFQVAVAHRHPNDVTYRIDDDRIRDYLRAIPDAGFDLCLHGSYRSTENPTWYIQEAALLGERLARPLGSRQHFLSFDYETLFEAQEQAGIQYDMSVGFPDRTGPRAGFSFPYFPYCLNEDRPFDVLEIGLSLMDVTLRSYMGLKRTAAWRVVEGTLADLRRKSGCVSVVWHPIVFGGARDPGYDRLFWDLVDRVRATGGVATDGRTINAYWRQRARGYASFRSCRNVHSELSNS